jgi:hypothetical protein
LASKIHILFLTAGGAAISRLDVRVIFGPGYAFHNWGISINDIRMWTIDPDNGFNYQTDALYNNLFHELGHRSHLRLVGTWNFGRSTDMLVESWAEYINCKMMLNVFPPPLNPGDVPELFDIELQRRDNTNSNFLNGYTPLFIDMVDLENQRSINGGRTSYPNDKVSGYNHTQLRDALNNSQNISELRDYLVNNYNNPTENQMNTYFNFMIPFE